MKQIIECVPNFSEGNDMNIIKQITEKIESVDGISLLDVDPGKRLLHLSVLLKRFQKLHSVL